MVKNLPADAGGTSGVDPWVGRIAWSRKWYPTPVFLPGKPHGQRSLEGYSPRGHKSRVQESGVTERLSTVINAFTEKKVNKMNKE